MPELPNDRQNLYRAAVTGVNLTPKERVAIQVWMERNGKGRNSKAFESARRKILRFGKVR